MNVCMFTNTYLPHVGGVARSVSAFSEDLREMGHKVLVIAPTFENLPKNEDEQQVLRITAIQNFNGSDFSVGISLPGVIDNAIKRFRPDIIHSHHPFLLGDAALRTAKRHRLPILFTHHTLYEQYTHYVPFDSERMKRFVINLSTEYANLCNGVIAPSTSVRKLLRKRGVERPVEVLPTGVDLAFFEKGRAETFRRRHGIPSDFAIIGHVGRLALEKNLPYLTSAVCHFMKKNTKYVFVVAGKGEAEAEIRKIFAAANLSDRLVMPGVLQGTELADCYKAMDVFVFASKSETQGMVIMEAMAAGVPVIALRASGVSDVMEDRRNGRMLNANSAVQTFAAALEQAFSSREIIEWRQNALDTAGKFSRRRCAEELLALYEKAIKEKVEPSSEEDVLDSLRRSIHAEWSLVQEKITAVKYSW